MWKFETLKIFSCGFYSIIEVNTESMFGLDFQILHVHGFSGIYDFICKYGNIYIMKISGFH